MRRFLVSASPTSQAAYAQLHQAVVSQYRPYADEDDTQLSGLFRAVVVSILLRLARKFTSHVVTIHPDDPDTDCLRSTYVVV